MEIPDKLSPREREEREREETEGKILRRVDVNSRIPNWTVSRRTKRRTAIRSIRYFCIPVFEFSTGNRDRYFSRMARLFPRVRERNQIMLDAVVDSISASLLIDVELPRIFHCPRLHSSGVFGYLGNIDQTLHCSHYGILFSLFFSPLPVLARFQEHVCICMYIYVCIYFLTDGLRCSRSAFYECIRVQCIVWYRNAVEKRGKYHREDNDIVV